MQIRSHRYIILLHDIAMIPLSWFLSLWLRFNLGEIPDIFFQSGIRILPLLMLVQLYFYTQFKTYRGYWRFVSVSDLLKIIKSVILAVIVTLTIVFMIWRLESVPRSLFPLHAILLVGLLSASRIFARWRSDKSLAKNDGKPVIIIGAGKAGEMLLRDLIRDQEKGYNPVALVDDDPVKKGKEIHGVRVFGGIDQLEKVVNKTGADLAILAIPSANTKQMKKIVEACEKSNVLMRTVPRLHDILSGNISMSSLKEVAIEDLLGRDSVRLDWDSINSSVKGCNIVVTGGGGSIGSELCRQIAGIGPKKLTIIDNSEFNLYSIDHELHSRYPDLDIHSVLLDVTDQKSIESLFLREKPDTVFHAAAYKHVPLLEHQMLVAVKNNVIGTKCVADAANSSGAGTFVLVSTDKAVNPTNIMGTTKRVAEIYTQTLNKTSKTKYITVRFGNVLGSAGSVIPLFRKQIASGGPVTVTHRDITRYFMTIPEATQLILQASVLGGGGEIFVLDMGDPIKISYLAEQMIILSGKQPGEDIDIIYTGLRPGEKLYEELFYNSEGHDKTAHNKIYKASIESADIEYIEECINTVISALNNSDQKVIISVLDKMVPENKISQITDN